MPWNGMDFVRRCLVLTNRVSKQRTRRLNLETLEDRSLPSATITGVVFQDFNANGLLDSTSTIANNGAGGIGTIGTARDQGVGGVTVQAFDVNNVLRFSTTTSANAATLGQYTLSPADAGASYRVEFSGLPAGFTPGPHGVAGGAFPDASGTTVQFVGAGATNHVDLGLVRADQYSPNNPILVTSVYYQGAVSPNNNAIVSFPYSAGETPLTTATPNNYNNPAIPTLAVPTSAVGSTFGLALAQNTGNLYASAFYKSFAAYGPGGPGAVYQIKTNPNGTFNSSSVFVNLDALFPGASGGDAHVTSFDDTNNAQWDAVGKTGLGGMAISPNGNTLYVMALGNRTLYAIPLNLGRALTSADVRGVAVPLNPPGSTNPGDVRPFSVTYYNGKIYVGVVNTAESTNPAISGSSSTANGNQTQLHAYVYAVTDSGASLTFGAAPVFDMDLGPAGGSLGTPTTYPRGFANKDVPLSPAGSANWLAWSSVVKNLETSGRGLTVYPQAMLTSLAFDANGNLVLGFRDRVGDETTPATALPQALPQGRPAGDVLRAFGNPTTGWTLENNGNGTAGAGNAKGPGGGEFYSQQDYPTYHDHVPLGSVIQIPGFPDVLSTNFDPVRDTAIAPLFSGGIRWFNNTNGLDDKDYLIYNRNLPAGNFGKANGMGGLTVMTVPAPIEIGNRVWLDVNGDGVQGAGEPAIAGVTVHLYAPNGVLLATVVTDSNGDYNFSNGAGVNGPGAVYNIAGLTANTAGYTVRLDNPANYTAGGPLAGLVPTLAFAASDPSVDSNGQIVAGFDRAAVAIGALGASDHTIDFGLFAPVGVSGFVYVDANNNGVRDAGDPPIAGNVITLLNASGVIVASTTTNANGFYQFTGLPPGIYTINEGPTPGYLDRTNNLGTVNGVPDGVVGPGRDQLSSVALASGQNGVNYNFGKVVPASLSGFVYVDGNKNGVRDPGDPPLSGVPVTLLGAGGNVVAVTTTDANGFYQFTNLAGGTYTIHEGLTPGYAEGTNTLGTVNGAADGVVGPAIDQFSGIVLTFGGTGINYNFGEIIAVVVPPGGTFVPPGAGIPLGGFVPSGTTIGKAGLLGSDVFTAAALADIAFVNRLYVAVLGRAPDQAGLNALVAALQSGLSRTAAAASLWNSPEHRGLEADALYQQILHRPSDAAGRAGLVQQLLSGVSEADLGRQLVDSVEYTATHPDAASFINGLYADVLGRASDAAALASYEQMLASGTSRDAVAKSFFTSQEYYTDIVDTLYLNFLKRPADAPGESAAVGALQRGGSVETTAISLLGSDEFFALGH